MPAFQKVTARWIAAITLAGMCGLPLAGRAQRRVPTADPEYSRIRYSDSLTSLNDRCMVRKSKLNLKVRPVYVNQQPVGFC